MEFYPSLCSSTDLSALKSFTHSRPGVRVVGKIRPFLDSDSVGQLNRSNISITPFGQDSAYIGFGDQNPSPKDLYKLDWCYEQNEGVEEIFSREVKPLLEDLFSGRNACVIAYGAKGSGKSQLIQGYEESPGLAEITISEILSLANEVGGSVAVSCYEVSQDRIFDVLEPKRQEVLVLEDAAKKIQLKGLSQVPINSVSDFKQLYYQVSSQKKACNKLTEDSTIKCHRGCIVYVFCGDRESKGSIVGKLNIIDLAGYEDSKQKGNAKIQVTESAKVNKSLYTLLNVVYALNSAETYVPYRESKMTRLLQDFLGRSTRSVLITCLMPIVCEDNIYVVKLASRSCQAVNPLRDDSKKFMKSSSRMLSSCSSPSVEGRKTFDTATKKKRLSIFASIEKRENGTPLTNQMRPKALVSSIKKQGGPKSALVDKQANDSPFTITGRPKVVVSSMKKQGDPKSALVDKQANDSPFTIKGRKLFNTVASPLAENLKVNVSPNVSVATDAFNQDNTTKVQLHDSNLDYTISEGDKVQLHVSIPDNTISKGDKVQLHASDPDYPISEVVTTVFKVDCKTNENAVIHGAEFGHGIIEKHGGTEESKSPRISDLLKDMSNSLKLFSITNLETPKPDQLCVKEMCKKVGIMNLETTKPDQLCVKEMCKEVGITNLEITKPDQLCVKEMCKEVGITNLETTKTDQLCVKETCKEVGIMNLETTKPDQLCVKEMCKEADEPKTPKVVFGTGLERGSNSEYFCTAKEVLKYNSIGLKKSLVKDCLNFLNSANKEELMALKGIGEKRANYILELREESPEPFKDIDDIKDIGLSSKQITAMMSTVLGEF